MLRGESQARARAPPQQRLFDAAPLPPVAAAVAAAALAAARLLLCVPGIHKRRHCFLTSNSQKSKLVGAATSETKSDNNNSNCSSGKTSTRQEPEPKQQRQQQQQHQHLHQHQQKQQQNNLNSIPRKLPEASKQIAAHKHSVRSKLTQNSNHFQTQPPNNNTMDIYDQFDGYIEYISIEDLQLARNSCSLCGCNWQQEHVSLDCPECDGYSLSRPCPECNGKCKTVWKRNISATHDRHRAVWLGQCPLASGQSGKSIAQRDCPSAIWFGCCPLDAESHAGSKAASQTLEVPNTNHLRHHYRSHHTDQRLLPSKSSVPDFSALSTCVGPQTKLAQACRTTVCDSTRCA